GRAHPRAHSGLSPASMPTSRAPSLLLLPPKDSSSCASPVLVFPGTAPGCRREQPKAPRATEIRRTAVATRLPGPRAAGPRDDQARAPPRPTRLVSAVDHSAATDGGVGGDPRANVVQGPRGREEPPGRN